MRNKLPYQQFSTWYSDNIGKFVLLSFLLSFMIFLSFATPYINTVFTVALVIALFLLVWQILFHPSIKTNVFISFVILSLAGLLTFFRFYAFAEYLGNILFLFIFFISVNVIITWVKKSQ